MQARKSKDGSITFRIPGINETYHSLDGALSESRYVYIENGLLRALRSGIDLNILELGFGMGYNSALTALEAKKKNLNVQYLSLEPFPIPWAEIEKANILSSLQNAELEPIFKKVFQCEWEKWISIAEEFSLCKTKTSIEQYSNSDHAQDFDLIYYDAFAPSKQPEVWAKKNLKKCFSWLKENGILCTYCSQGQFKRDLEEVGFNLEATPGFSKKREMTVAIKP